LDTIRTLKDNGINAYFQKEGLSLFGTDGKENPYLAVMVSAWETNSVYCCSLYSIYTQLIKNICYLCTCKPKGGFILLNVNRYVN
jgi:hypothetical protein